MEDGDTEKYYPSSVIQDFVFSSQKSGCIRYISLQVYNKCWDHIAKFSHRFLSYPFLKVNNIFTSPENSWIHLSTVPQYI